MIVSREAPVAAIGVVVIVATHNVILVPLIADQCLNSSAEIGELIEIDLIFPIVCEHVDFRVGRSTNR